MQSQPTLWSVAHLARILASPETGAAWVMRVAVSCSSGYELLLSLDLLGPSLKTSLAYCRKTEDGRLAPCSGRWMNSGMGGPTEFLTLNTSEWPSDAEECSLSDTLEANGDMPQRYFLSSRACEGILRRAQNTGKTLPPEVQTALEVQAQSGPEKQGR